MDNQKIILGFVGSIVSGKGTTCEYLTKKYNAGTTRFSSILRDILSRVYLEHSRDNLQKLSTVLRQNFGEDVLSMAILKDVLNDKHDIVGVDGIRRFSDIEHLSKTPGFYLVSIEADEKIRYERIIKRAENSDDSKKTFERFHEDNQKEAELQIREVQNKAAFHVNNNGTFEDLYKNIDQIIKKIKTQ